MNVLLLGSGGREHAIAWKLKQSPLLHQLYIAPGNPGTAKIGINLPLNNIDFEAIASALIQYQIKLVICGPEEPLVKGLRDFLYQNELTSHIYFIGPGIEGAQLEGSKEFSKHFMFRHQIPTAACLTVTAQNIEAGKKLILETDGPVVLKADGLAAGKGVIITEDKQEAIHSLDAMLGGMFGKASEVVLIEQFLKGIELSVFVLTDGKDYILLPEAKDYKRIGEGDTGLNTGGMGAVSPVPFANSEFMDKVIKRIIEPTIRGLSSDNIPYKGFIFFGLINVDDDPWVIEYNCRMGDPETEVVMPRISSDFLKHCIACCEGTLSEEILFQHPDFCTTVMTVSSGYPGNYEKGFEFSESGTAGMIFHAGTAMLDGKIVTSGGRVAACTALGESLLEALAASMTDAEKISFQAKYFRKDIGKDLI